MQNRSFSTLAEVYDFLLRRWKMIANVSIVSSAAFAAGSSAFTPSYEAAAQILYDQPEYYSNSSDNSSPEFRDNSTYIDSQISFLSSTSILRRVIESEGLAGDKPCQTFLSCAKIEVRSSILNSGVRVVTLAELPEAPSFPQRPLFAAVGLAFGMLLGGAGALMRELLTLASWPSARSRRPLRFPFWLLCPD